MPYMTLDEYLKQTIRTTTERSATKQKYRITGFHKETQFQETPIGKIPKEWQIVKLYEISDKIKAGGTPRVSKKEYWNGSIPFVKIEDLTAFGKYLYSTKTFITELGLEKSNAWIVPEESLLLAMYGSMGEVAINKIKVATNQAILGIIPRRGVTHVEYLYYWFLYFKPKWRIYAKWTTQPNLTAEIVKNSYVPLPPLEEQWGIAKVLSSVDEAIEATERLIGRLERLKQGLMKELLTKGIGHREYKQTPIGKIPKEWRIVKLGVLFNFRNGKRPKTVGENGQIPIYGAGFIQGYTDDFMVDEDNVIIIARVGKGSAGKVYIASGKMWISDNAIYATPKSNRVYPVFYYYLLQFLRLDKIAVRSAAGGYSLITQSSLNNLYVPLPPYEEQKQIADTLSSIDNWVKQEKKFKDKLERLKRGLMELLLTGRVRVRVEGVSYG